eukprot:96343_1
MADQSTNLYIEKKDVKHYTNCIGSVIHPIKGRILFATKNIAKNSVIHELYMDDIKLFLLPNIIEYRKYLKQLNNVKEMVKCVEHSIPTADGKILIPNDYHWNNFFNHSISPNVNTTCNFYTKEKWKLIAIKDIRIGDELT